MSIEWTVGQIVGADFANLSARDRVRANEEFDAIEALRRAGGRARLVAVAADLKWSCARAGVVMGRLVDAGKVDVAVVKKASGHPVNEYGVR